MTLGCNQLVEESIPGLSDQDSAVDLYPQAAVDNQEGIQPLVESELPPIFCVRRLFIAQYLLLTMHIWFIDFYIPEQQIGVYLS